MDRRRRQRRRAVVCSFPETEPSQDGNGREQPQRPSSSKQRTKGAYGNCISYSKNINGEEGIIDKSSDIYQRTAWYQLKTSIYILINKVNPINVGTVKKELLKLNILRGKGLFCKFIIQAQEASTNESRVYATLVAVINLVFPEIGKLLLTRCIQRFKTTYYSVNKKYKCLASVILIAHLINHGVADEMLAIELLTLLLGTLQTTVSIETAIIILKICGKKVSLVHKKRMDAILDIMHSISLDEQLHEKIQNKIKWILKLHENGFKVKQLDLVLTDDCQITHFLSLNSDDDTNDTIDYYHYDPNFEENEKNYKLMKIKSSQELETEDESSFEYTNYDDNYKNDQKVKYIKQTNDSEIYPNMISMRKICLRNSVNVIVDFSLDYNENGHKLMEYGQKMEQYLMFLDRCYEQGTYEDNFGFIAQGVFQKINCVAESTKTVCIYSYVTSHSFNVHKLRIVVNLLFHLLLSNSIYLKELLIMNHKDNKETSSNKSYTKILSQEIIQCLKYNNLHVHVQDLDLHFNVKCHISNIYSVFRQDNDDRNKFRNSLRSRPKQLVSIAVIDD